MEENLKCKILTISWVTLRSESSRCRCSIVEANASLFVPRGDDNREQRERPGGRVKAHSKLGKASRFFGFQRGVVADVEAVKVDMLDLGMVFVFLAKQPTEAGLAAMACSGPSPKPQ
jgi:hypothetical protein